MDGDGADLQLLDRDAGGRALDVYEHGEAAIVLGGGLGDAQVVPLGQTREPRPRVPLADQELARAVRLLLLRQATAVEH